jgi:hypothetical protein
MAYHPLVGRRAAFRTTHPLRAAGLRSARQGIIAGVAKENAERAVHGKGLH